MPFASGKDVEAPTKEASFSVNGRNCSACQLEMHRLIQDYPKFEAKGAKVFVVLQSEPEQEIYQGRRVFYLPCL